MWTKTNDIHFVASLVATVTANDEDYDVSLPLTSTNTRRFSLIDNVWSIPFLYLEIEIPMDFLFKLENSYLFGSSWRIAIKDLYRENHTVLRNALYRVINYSVKSRKFLFLYAIPEAAYKFFVTPVPAKTYSNFEDLLVDFCNIAEITFDSKKSAEFLNEFDLKDTIPAVSIHNLSMHEYVKSILMYGCKTEENPPVGIMRYTNKSLYIEPMYINANYIGTLLRGDSVGYNYADFDEFVETILDYDVYIRNYNKETKAFYTPTIFNSDESSDITIDYSNLLKTGAYIFADSFKPTWFIHNTVVENQRAAYIDDILRAPNIQLNLMLQGNLLLTVNRMFNVLLSDPATTDSRYNNITSLDGLYYAGQLYHDILFAAPDSDAASIFVSRLTLIKNAFQITVEGSPVEQHNYRSALK